nr:Biomphalaria glabrata kynurenine/alpha-aminoadipate aminotransferase; mitochondrial-like; transcript variant X1 [Biomphalaria glabrata]
MMPKPASIKVYGINGELLRKTFLNDLFKQILSDVYTGSELSSFPKASTSAKLYLLLKIFYRPMQICTIF